MTLVMNCQAVQCRDLQPGGVNYVEGQPGVMFAGRGGYSQEGCQELFPMDTQSELFSKVSPLEFHGVYSPVSTPGFSVFDQPCYFGIVASPSPEF